jgi:hypothetical protein
LFQKIKTRHIKRFDQEAESAAGVLETWPRCAAVPGYRKPRALSSKIHLALIPPIVRRRPQHLQT